MKLTFFLLCAVLWCVVAAAKTTEQPQHQHATSVAVKNDNEHKHARKSGKDTKHVSEVGHKGHAGSISHKIDDEEKALKKTISKSFGGHHTYKKSGAHQEHSAKAVESGKHKKNAANKGFHEQYHKNEHKKHDSFYAHGKKSGDWKTFGAKNAKHSGHKVEKAEHKSKLTLKSLDKHGKTTRKASGHKVDEHKGHKLDKSKKSHFEKQQKWNNKHPKPEDKHKYKHSLMH